MKRRTRNKRQASVLIYTVALLALIVVISTTYVDRSTLAMRNARQNMYDVQLTMLCEAGVTAEARSLWRPFKTKQDFVDLDAALTSASLTTPKSALSGDITGIGRYSAGVTAYFAPGGDPYQRTLRIRTVGWVDRNANSLPDLDEPQRTVDVTYGFVLKRSGVFDYTYFVNNFGWMTGFNKDNLIINGDMRSNGDFTFTNGSGTVNGSVIASYNNKLTPVAAGLINLSPSKWSTSTYNSAQAGASGSRMRPGYSTSLIGSPGDSNFNAYRDLVYRDTASMVDGRPFGSVLEDAKNTRAWTYSGSTLTTTVLDETASVELPMPDLSDFGSPGDPANPNGKRFAKSKAWTDEKNSWLDGTGNPNGNGHGGTSNEFNGDGSPNIAYTGAYLDVWDSSKNKYKRVSSKGVVSASVLLSGTSTNPIRIHGPVSVNGDIGIAGYVSGQGTIYCSRNAHVLGSVYYKNPPDFRGNNMNAIDQTTEKKDMLGIAAAQSIMMGNTTTFGANPLNYMTPPFTKARLDDNGNTIPAFNATSIDGWGIKKYQSLLQSGATAAAYASMASGGVNQIDAVMYTNFAGGGNVGTAGGGFTVNGSLISKDEAIVTWSLPLKMNYDNRIRERTATQKPLIDIDIPRSPLALRSSWQDRGFHSK